MSTEVTVQLRVLGGENLPKTDLTSEIDPFLKVFFNDSEVRCSRKRACVRRSPVDLNAAQTASCKQLLLPASGPPPLTHV